MGKKALGETRILAVLDDPQDELPGSNETSRARENKTGIAELVLILTDLVAIESGSENFTPSFSPVRLPLLAVISLETV